MNERENRANYGIITRPNARLSGGAVASRLVRSTPDRVVRVRALAGVTVLCSSRHFTLTVLIFAQVYKWVTSKYAGGNPAMD